MPKNFETKEIGWPHFQLVANIIAVPLARQAHLDGKRAFLSAALAQQIMAGEVKVKH